MSLGQFALLYTALAVGMPAGLASLVLQAQVGSPSSSRRWRCASGPAAPRSSGSSSARSGSASSRVGRGRHDPGARAGARRRRRDLLGGRQRRRPPRGRRGGRAPAAPDRGGRPPCRAASAPGLSMTVWSALVVPLPLLALSLALDGPDAVGHALTHLTVAAVLSTLYTAWLASLVGYGIWNTLLARHPAAAVVPYTMLVPVVGLTTAWLVQGEAPNALGGRRAARCCCSGSPSRRACWTRVVVGAGLGRAPAAAAPSPPAGRPSADTRPMIRGSCSPTTRHLLLELAHRGHALGERRPDRPGVRGHRGVLVARAQLAGQPLAPRAPGRRRPATRAGRRAACGAPARSSRRAPRGRGPTCCSTAPARLVGPHPEVRDRRPRPRRARRRRTAATRPTVPGAGRPRRRRPRGCGRCPATCHCARRTASTVRT